MGKANAMGPKQFHDVVMAFPETEFTTSYGQPAYKAFGKFFTRLRKEDDSIVLGMVPFDEREMLCGAEPETFHFTDHYRNYPIVLARLNRLDARRLRAYLTRQWRHNAPKIWLKKFDAGDPVSPVVKKRTRTAAKPQKGKSK
jgi:hypothetical protein